MSEIYNELIDDQDFGLSFFPILTYISAYVPWLKYITGGIIGRGDLLLRKMALFRELLGFWRPVVLERLAEREKGESVEDGQFVDQMQVLINQGDGGFAVLYVRNSAVCNFVSAKSFCSVHDDIYIRWTAWVIPPHSANL